MNRQTTDTVWKSGRFSVAPSCHATLEMETLAGRWWWVGGIPTAILLGLGIFVDWRYGIVAGMLALTVRPILALGGWVRALGSKGALMSVYDMEADIGPDGMMTLSFYHKPAHQDSEDESHRPTVTPCDDTQRHPEPELPAPAPLHLPLSNLQRLRLWKGHIVMIYDSLNIIIPLSDDIRPTLPALLKLTGM